MCGNQTTHILLVRMYNGTAAILANNLIIPQNLGAKLPYGPTITQLGTHPHKNTIPKYSQQHSL